MVVDVNVLVYAVHSGAPQHQAARDWIAGELAQHHRVALPWQSLGGFVRVVTHPRILPRPLSSEQAWGVVEDWLDAPGAWTPTPGDAYDRILGALLCKYRLTGDLVPDAMLAALAVEHGLPLCSTDTDFARFSELRWFNPVAA